MCPAARKARRRQPPARRKPPPRPKPADIWPPLRRPWGAYLREHGRVAKEGFDYVATNLGSTLLVWLLIGIALFLPAAFHLLDANLARPADDWLGASGFSVYFAAEADPQRASALAARLQREPDVVGVRTITPAQALAALRRESDLGDVLNVLETNPLPSTLRVTIDQDARAGRLTALSALARRSDGVDEVVVETTWLERLAAIRSVTQRLAWLLAALVSVGAVLISTASVRLAIESRLAEVRVLTLVGASRRFVRRPFLYLGIVYGLGGGTVAGMLVAVGLAWLEAPLARIARSYGQSAAEGLELVGFDPMFMATLLASGAVLGVLGAVIASNQRLKRLAAV